MNHSKIFYFYKVSDSDWAPSKYYIPTNKAIWLGVTSCSKQSTKSYFTAGFNSSNSEINGGCFLFSWLKNTFVSPCQNRQPICNLPKKIKVWVSLIYGLFSFRYHPR